MDIGDSHSKKEELYGTIPETPTTGSPESFLTGTLNPFTESIITIGDNIKEG